MPKVKDIPQGLKAFIWHGMDLSVGGDGNAIADCPFCGREGKMSIDTSTSKWQCWGCSAGEGKGNAVEFLRLLWKASDEVTTDYGELAEDRGLLFQVTAMAWGCVQSVLTGEWMVPGYDEQGKLQQLYRWVDLNNGKRSLVPTPGVHQKAEAHGLFGVPLFDRKRKDVWLCEGPWDAMILWEALGGTKSKVNVLAVPGCGVFRGSWLPLFRGKKVGVLFDNDHPRQVKQPDGKTKEVLGAGWLGNKRTAGILLASKENTPTECLYLSWGKGKDHDPALPDGFDVRNLLSAHHIQQHRASVFTDLCKSRLLPCPKEWAEEVKKAGQEGKKLQPKECRSWQMLVAAWEKALRWRQDLQDVFAVMLAVAVSTEQQGDQLFLQVVGEPGSAKSRMCEAMLVSPKCKRVDHLTGFFSGYTDGSDKDFSFLARADRRTWITSEGDVMVSNPRFQELMSQMRKIFDGSSSATYKNRDQDLEYDGLRTPWIMAGTLTLLSSDQSRLGDRFLRVMVEAPVQEERRAILMRAGSSAWHSVELQSNGRADTVLGPEMTLAYALTGGYVEHLRSHAGRLLRQMPEDVAILERCADLAEFTADMRARPEPPSKGGQEREAMATKELPTRLMLQFVRLARCLAAVFNKGRVGQEEMRIVSKVARDTSMGRSLNIVKKLSKFPQGLVPQQLALHCSETEDRLRPFAAFLERIDVVEYHRMNVGPGLRGKARLRLTERFASLWSRVME